MPKPRSDKKLGKLPQYQREALKRWLVEENLSYKAAKERLYQDFNVETSEGALSKFFNESCFTAKFEEAASFADHVAEHLAAEGADKFDAATLALCKQKAFEFIAVKDGNNIKDFERLARIIGESAKHRLKERELELNLAKFRSTTATAVEKGLDALFADIKGNPEAEELFAKLKACVLDRIEGKETAS